MTDLATNLECLVCGRWWITAVGGFNAGPGWTLCPGCEVTCGNCGTSLTTAQLRQRRANTKSRAEDAAPACSISCGLTLSQGRA